MKEKKTQSIGSMSDSTDEEKIGKLELDLGADISNDLKATMVTEDVIEAAEHLTLEEAKDIIQAAIEGRQSDPNFDQSLLNRATAALAASDGDLTSEVARQLVEEIKLEAALFDDSPYVEVRAAVSNTDDPTIFVNTFRSWFIGMIFTILGTGINVFFSARNPNIIVNTFTAQVLAYPFGKFLEKVLPTKSVSLFGRQWSLNPGKFSMKEHMLITIMANVTFGGITGVYSTDIIYVQRLPQFFNQTQLGSDATYQILLTLSTQLIGFSLAGLTRRFLVYPPAMIWPANLATIVLNRSFHTEANPKVGNWAISRFRFFLIVFFAYGVYFIFPDAIFSALLYFNWITWIAPSNVTLAIWTGSISGLGLNPITTFDWSYLSALNNPLITPLFATLNLYVGAAVLGLTIIPALYFTNTWFTSYIPINSNHIYDNTGNHYNISSVLNSDFTLNITAYERYSDVYQSAGNAMVFFAFFAIYTSTLVHVGLYYRKELTAGVKAAFKRKNPREAYADVHNRLMLAYPEIPEWWFGLVLVISVAFGIAVQEKFQTQLPIGMLLFAIVLGFIFLIPIGIIQAITNIPVTVNVMAELICGYALPGKPLAVMIFKTYGFISTAQAVGYAGDMKLGHYCKIPPRKLFVAQLVASIVASFVGIGVADWQIGNIEGICGAAQVNGFTCPGYNTFFNSAVQWGSIGPARLYSHGRLYYPLVFGFLAGAISPFLPWYMTRRYPNSMWKYVSTPVFWYGGINWAPYNLSYLTPSIPLAIFFQGYLRNKHTAWWAKYNYILASALTASISVFGVIYFFAILYGNFTPNWWGNNIPFEGCDAIGCPLLPIPDIGYFGPVPVGR